MTAKPITPVLSVSEKTSPAKIAAPRAAGYELADATRHVACDGRSLVDGVDATHAGQPLPRRLTPFSALWTDGIAPGPQPHPATIVQ